MGRISGMSDLRIPRPWERASSPAKFKKGHERALPQRDPFANYCRKCRRTHAWCECAQAGNTCKE